MTLKQAMETKLPFKAKSHFWWFNPNSYPDYLDQYKDQDWKGDTWEVGSFAELEEQEKKMEKFIKGSA